MKRKLLICLLMVTLIVCMVPLTAFADEGAEAKLASKLGDYGFTGYKESGEVISDYEWFRDYGLNDCILIGTGTGQAEQVDETTYGWPVYYQLNLDQDEDLKALFEIPEYITMDTSSVEFTFTAPITGTFSFDYVFKTSTCGLGGWGIPDIFAIFSSVNDGEYKNIATFDDGRDVSINNIYEEYNAVQPMGMDSYDEEGLVLFTDYFLYRQEIRAKYEGDLDQMTEEEWWTLMDLADLVPNLVDKTTKKAVCYPGGKLGCLEVYGNVEEYSLHGVTDVLTCKQEVTKGDKVTIKAVVTNIEDAFALTELLIDPSSMEFIPAEGETGGVFLAVGAVDDGTPLTEKLISAEELAAHQGEPVKAWVNSKEVKLEEVSETDKALIMEQLPEGYNVNAFFDITVWKQFGSSNASKIEVLPNGNLKIALSVPEKLKDCADKIKVIRLHDGEAVLLDGAYDSANNTFVFESDMYSLYALVSTSTATVTGEDKLMSPETGINDLSLVTNVMALSVLTFALVAVLKKKEEK